MNEIPLWLRALVAVTTSVGAIAATVASGKVVFGNLSFRSHSEVIVGELTAIIPGSNYGDEWTSLRKFDAPQLPNDGIKHELDHIQCRHGYSPVAATAVAHTSWPDPGVMYSINAGVEDGKVVIGLRSRKKDYFTGHDYVHGYAYIKVAVTCMLGRFNPDELSQPIAPPEEPEEEPSR